MKRSVRVYWPLDVLELERQHDYQPSLIVGWRNGNYDLMVVTTLPFLDPRIVDTILLKDDLLRDGKHLPPHIYELCGVKRLSILGVLNPEQRQRPDQAFKKGFISRFDDNLKYPVAIGGGILSKYIIQTILFRAPRPYRMQYFSLYPISLELSEKSNLTVISEEYEAHLVRTSMENRVLRDQILKHTREDLAVLANERIKLENCISQINCCYELGELMRKNASILFPRIRARRRRLSVGESVLEGAKSVHNEFWELLYHLWQFTLPLIARMMFCFIMVIRTIGEGILVIIEWKFTKYAIKDVSATAQQIDLRLQQFCYWPIQYIRISKKHNGWLSNTDFNIEYIRFYNSIWLVLNDIILGVTIGNIFLDNKHLILCALTYIIDEILTIQFKNTMLWLMDWPAGLKLNNELAAFFGELFLWVIQFWGVFLNLFRPYFSMFLTIIGYSGYFGVTLTVSIVSDVISLLTLHVYSFYIASARIYHWQLQVLYSLFQLFRGKKQNMLRQRIDSYNYELDQLLMGTIFFTVLIFLLPTVLVFYLSFASARLTIVVCCSVLESILAFLNHFPLFAILLRFKDPKRLPGGIRLECKYGHNKTTSANWLTDGLNQNASDGEIVLFLFPIPLGFDQLFHQYKILGGRLRMHYLSGSIIKRILTGRFVPIQRSKLYGLLYSMLPEKRISLSALYQELWLFVGACEKVKEN